MCEPETETTIDLTMYAKAPISVETNPREAAQKISQTDGPRRPGAAVPTSGRGREAQPEGGAAGEPPRPRAAGRPVPHRPSPGGADARRADGGLT